ncbi:type IX secretion system protein PorQ [Aquimarina sp. 2201CG5-10]|uniref:type IX secretion system protein PorQ n=1 Tax=Aquimarina callyspongiae TaxID=3098150 RepID=UPI002AB36368|nr:type IX secretion system protein PorQ [Aquimarina sp. 2201CG5-10]MDY8136263.1 type IX secretion system protein PorQ [Aquimarina sp. 2201CG5-10]
MIRNYLFLVLFFITISSFAQIGGRYTYQFLNLVSSPRQAALGGKYVTGYNTDPTSAMLNPASINKEMDRQLAVNYVNYIADVNYGSVAYVRSFGEKERVFHAGITYINYGSFDGFDEFGNETEDFSAGEVAVSVGYAYNIPNSDIHVGANAKFISSKLEEFTSIGGALDLGLIYHNPETKFDFGLVVRNLGTQFTTYADTREDLPLSVDAGIGQTLSGVPVRWNLTLENLHVWDIAFRNPARDLTDLEGNVEADDPSFFNNALRHVVLGLELFPEKGFNIRLGYNFRRSEELRIVDQRSFAGLSGGFALKLGKFKFAYSYARYNSAAATSTFGINVNLQ